MIECPCLHTFFFLSLLGICCRWTVLFINCEELSHMVGRKMKEQQRQGESLGAILQMSLKLSQRAMFADTEPLQQQQLNIISLFSSEKSRTPNYMLQTNFLFLQSQLTATHSVTHRLFEDSFRHEHFLFWLRWSTALFLYLMISTRLPSSPALW